MPITLCHPTTPKAQRLAKLAHSQPLALASRPPKQPPKPGVALGLQSTGLLRDSYSATPIALRAQPNRIRIHRHITRSKKLGEKQRTGRGGRSPTSHPRACARGRFPLLLKFRLFLPPSAAIMLPIGPMGCIIQVHTSLLL